MRSKLFVPGSRPELFAKALAGPADALSFDLEDSVDTHRKAEARLALQALWTQPHLNPLSKTLIVRINGLDTPHAQDDLEAVVRPGVHLINLPKVESVEQVLQACRWIDAIEHRHSMATSPVRLLLNIETPTGLRLAATLGACHPRVAGLQLGLGDLFEPLNIDRREPAAVHTVMLQLRLAAGEAGVFAYDAAYADIHDAAGFRAEAALARRLGYLGKSCIHPSQVALAHEAFRPSDADIAHAQRVVDAAAVAQAQGLGAWKVDGKMVDAPFLLRARTILAQAQGLGLILRNEQ